MTKNKKDESQEVSNNDDLLEKLNEFEDKLNKLSSENKSLKDENNLNPTSEVELRDVMLELIATNKNSAKKLENELVNISKNYLPSIFKEGILANENMDTSATSIAERNKFFNELLDKKTKENFLLVTSSNKPKDDKINAWTNYNITIPEVIFLTEIYNKSLDAKVDEYYNFSLLSCYHEQGNLSTKSDREIWKDLKLRYGKKIFRYKHEDLTGQEILESLFGENGNKIKDYKYSYTSFKDADRYPKIKIYAKEYKESVIKDKNTTYHSISFIDPKKG